MTDKKGRRNIYPSSNFCIIRDNLSIQQYIRMRIDKDVNVKKMCRDLNIDISNLRNFVNLGKKTLSQYKVIEIMEYLGHEVSVVFKNFSSG